MLRSLDTHAHRFVLIGDQKCSNYCHPKNTAACRPGHEYLMHQKQKCCYPTGCPCRGAVATGGDATIKHLLVYGVHGASNCGLCAS